MGSWGTLVFGALLAAAMIASYNMPGTSALPGRLEKPKAYWTYLGVGVASIIFGALSLLFGPGL